MSAFAEKEAENMRTRARLRLPDEDGFITVVRGGRVAPARQEEAAAIAEKKKGKAEHQDFYRFQVREVRKERHLQLLAKFQQDKRKVAARKELRKFRVWFCSPMYRAEWIVANRFVTLANVIFPLVRAFFGVWEVGIHTIPGFVSFRKESAYFIGFL